MLRLAGSFHAESVRELATARLRGHPQFLDALIGALREPDPSKALDFVAHHEFSSAERHRLAEPIRDAMLQFCDKIQNELRYMPARRQKILRRSGRDVYAKLAAAFAGTGVDLQSAATAFNEAFSDPAVNEV